MSSTALVIVTVAGPVAPVELLACVNAFARLEVSTPLKEIPDAQHACAFVHVIARVLAPEAGFNNPHISVVSSKPLLTFATKVSETPFHVQVTLGSFPDLLIRTNNALAVASTVKLVSERDVPGLAVNWVLLASKITAISAPSD